MNCSFKKFLVFCLSTVFLCSCLPLTRRVKKTVSKDKTVKNENRSITQGPPHIVENQDRRISLEPKTRPEPVEFITVKENILIETVKQPEKKEPLSTNQGKQVPEAEKEIFIFEREEIEETDIIPDQTSRKIFQEKKINVNKQVLEQPQIEERTETVSSRNDTILEPPFTSLEETNVSPISQPQPQPEKMEMELFPTTKQLAGAVRFWIEVFGRYTSDQIVIHNKIYPEIIYTVFDTSEYKRNNFSYQKILKLRRKKVKEIKRKYSLVLQELAGKASKPSTLSGETSRIYNLFLHIKDKDKFKKSYKLRQIRAQVGQKDRFLKALVYSGLYMKRMEQIFIEEGVPQELTRLPFVESAFNTYAYSSAGAAGIWQFIRSTGKMFLAINSRVDERRDPYKATRAAARLLALNYRHLGNWPLAITAYNHGHQGLEKAIKLLKTDDIGIIAQKYRGRRFGFASRNYYAQFLAVNRIYPRYRKYFGEIYFKQPWEYDEVKLKTALRSRKIVKDCGLSIEDFKIYNPELRASVFKYNRYNRQLPKGYRLRLPVGTAHDFLRRYTDMLKSPGLKAGGYHLVKGKETLSKIAGLYSTDVGTIKRLNSLKNKDYLQIGQRLRIPRKGISGKAATQRIESKSSQKKITVSREEDHENIIKHRIKKGENLTYLAQKYSVSVGDLRRYNSLDRKATIYAGQVLTIPAVSSSGAKVSDDNDREDDDMLTNPAGYTGDYLKHFVKRGDNLWVLAKRYGTTVKQLRRINNIKKKHYLPVGEKIKIPRNYLEYKVKKGDSIWSLAKQYGTTITKLRLFNKLKKKDNLHIGKVLKIPGNYIEYTVKKGDSLWNLAKLFRTTIKKLRLLNNLRKNRELRLGEELIIPGV